MPKLRAFFAASCIKRDLYNFSTFSVNPVCQESDAKKLLLIFEKSQPVKTVYLRLSGRREVKSEEYKRRVKKLIFESSQNYQFFSVFTDYQVSSGRNEILNFSLDCSSSTREFSNEPLKQNVGLVVWKVMILKTESCSHKKAFPAYQHSDPKNYFTEKSASNKKLLNDTLMIKLNPLLSKKSEFHFAEKSEQFAHFGIRVSQNDVIQPKNFSDFNLLYSTY